MSKTTRRNPREHQIRRIAAAIYNHRNVGTETTPNHFIGQMDFVALERTADHVDDLIQNYAARRRELLAGEKQLKQAGEARGHALAALANLKGAYDRTLREIADLREQLVYAREKIMRGADAFAKMGELVAAAEEADEAGGFSDLQTAEQAMKGRLQLGYGSVDDETHKMDWAAVEAFLDKSKP